MTYIQTKRTRPWERPTEHQVKAAEDAAFKAMHRGHAVLVSQTKPTDSTKDTNKMMTKDPSLGVKIVKPKDPVATLGSKPLDEFLFSFRVNGLECMTTAYE